MNLGSTTASVLDDVWGVAARASLGHFSSERDCETFVRDAQRFAEPFEVMWGRRYGVEELLSSYMEHLHEVVSVAADSTNPVDAWAEEARDPLRTFYLISSHNIVTTGTRLLRELDKARSNADLWKLAQYMGELYERGLKTELSLYKYIKPWKPYTQQCREARHQPDPYRRESCIDCTRLAIGGEKIRPALSRVEEKERNALFGLHGGFKDNTSNLDATAKRDMAFNFYFLESTQQSARVQGAHAQTYGSLCGVARRSLECDAALRFSLVQTHDLVTPELPLLEHRRDLDLEKVFGPSEWETFTRGTIKNVRYLPSWFQALVVQRIKAIGFGCRIGETLEQVMPLELIFVWPHALVGLRLRAWLHFLRIITCSGDPRAHAGLSEMLRQPGEAIGRLFRIQVLIPRSTSLDEHDWRVIEDEEGKGYRST